MNIQSDCLWDTFTEEWNITEQIWNLCHIIKKLRKKGRSSGGLIKEFGKLKQEEKKKLIKVILFYKNVKHIDQHVVENYKVAVEDLKMIIKEFNKIEKKVIIENLVLK